MIKRLAVFALVLMGFVGAASMPAKADTISFNSNTAAGSSWSLSGAPLTFGLSSILTSAQLNLFSPVSIANGMINWTTGAASTTTSSLIIFNPGGSINVTGDLGSGVVSLFTGSFQNASLTLLTGGAPGQSSFSASFVAGNINPALYSFLGSAGLPPAVTGTLTSTLNSSFTSSGGSGSVAGASISLNPVVPAPEPSMLLLFGPALMALAGLVTLRKAKPLLRS